MFRFARRRPAATVSVALVALLAASGLASCAAPSPASSPAHGSASHQGSALKVVASTSVYGSLAKAVAGDDADVESIISSPSQDPHSYEATARDKLTLSHAQLVVLNGGGYDDFAVQIVESLPTQPTVIKAMEGEGHSHDHAAEGGESPAASKSPAAEDEHGHDHDHGHDHGAGNEHVWYDLHQMQHLTDHLKEGLSTADPEHSAGYAERAAQLNKKLEGLEERAHGLEKKSKGATYIMTEPVPQALLETAGLKNVTPEGLAESIEEGDEIAPLAMKAATDALEAGKVTVFAFNSQTADDQTNALKAAAQRGGVPVLDVTETLPEGQDYLGWMGKNIDRLEEALNAAK